MTYKKYNLYSLCIVFSLIKTNVKYFHVIIRVKVEAERVLNVADGFLSLSYRVHVKWDSPIHRRRKFFTYINLYIFYVKLGRFVLASVSRVWCHSYVQTNVLLSTTATSTDLAALTLDFCFIAETAGFCGYFLLFCGGWRGNFV